jgi:hypothetical protein
LGGSNVVPADVVLCEHERWAVMVDLTVGADYFQYWLSDSVAQFDPAGGAEQQDGVIAPLGTAIQVCTGANMTEGRCSWLWERTPALLSRRGWAWLPPLTCGCLVAWWC